MLLETIISTLSVSKIKRKADEAEQAYFTAAKLGTFPEAGCEYEYFKLMGFMKWNLFTNKNHKVDFINNYNKALYRLNQIGIDITKPPFAVYFYINRFGMVYFYTQCQTFNRVLKLSIDKRMGYLNGSL